VIGGMLVYKEQACPFPTKPSPLGQVPNPFWDPNRVACGPWRTTEITRCMANPWDSPTIEWLQIQPDQEESCVLRFRANLKFSVPFRTIRSCSGRCSESRDQKTSFSLNVTVLARGGSQGQTDWKPLIGSGGCQEMRAEVGNVSLWRQ